MKPWEYDNLSPAELNMMIDVYNDNRTREQENIIIQAYYTAALQRAKKMPKLDKLLKDISPRKKRKMSAEEMFEVVKGLNAAFGGD